MRRFLLVLLLMSLSAGAIYAFEAEIPGRSIPPKVYPVVSIGEVFRSF